MSAPAVALDVSRLPQSTARRWWRFVPDRGLYCPNHHPISNRFRPLECGFVQCAHIEPNGGQPYPCDRWVFVYLIRGGCAVEVEVTPSEQRMLSQLKTPAEIFSTLGVFTP